MKIETMLKALVMSRTRPGTFDRRNRQFHTIYAGIMRRYIRLQQENAWLRDDVAFWKLEAQRGEGDDE